MQMHIGEAAMPKRAAIYVRVSTDKQTIENQLRELHQIAERRGWEVVKEYRDAGIEGTRSRTGARRNAQRRPKPPLRYRHGLGDRPARPIADRPARHHSDARTLRRRPVPRSAGHRHDYAGWAADVSNNRRVRRVRKEHDPPAHQRGPQKGRPELEKRIQSQLQAGKGMLRVAAECGVGSGTVQRIKREMADRPFGGAAAA
jgi:hypothetical protein